MTMNNSNRLKEPSWLVQDMMLGHTLQNVNVPDLPTLDTKSPEVINLIAKTVWKAAKTICMWDLAVDKVIVKKSGIKVIPDLAGVSTHYVMPEEVRESLVEIPLPEGVWFRLQKLAQ